jgi:hypothetical protein
VIESLPICSPFCKDPGSSNKGDNYMNEDGTVEDLSNVDIWIIVSVFRNPMGSAVALSPGVPTPMAPPFSEIQAKKARYRQELLRRGYTEKECDAVDAGDDRPIMDRL